VSGDHGTKKVVLYLPEPLYSDLLGFAEDRGETMTGLFRWALGLSKAVWDEVKAGNRIRVARDGKVVKEFVIEAPCAPSTDGVELRITAAGVPVDRCDSCGAIASEVLCLDCGLAARRCLRRLLQALEPLDGDSVDACASAWEIDSAGRVDGEEWAAEVRQLMAEAREAIGGGA
jgi:hypothetical protein